MAGSNSSSASSSSPSSPRTREQPSTTAGPSTATVPPVSRSPKSTRRQRRRQRRNTVTTRRASVMVDHDNEISISNQVIDTARVANTVITTTNTGDTGDSGPQTAPAAASRRDTSFYQLQVPLHRNMSSTSVDSAGLLDHREQKYARPRRSSTMGLGEVVRSHRSEHYRHAHAHQSTSAHGRSGTGGGDGATSPGKRHHSHGYFEDYTLSGEDSTPELRRGPTGDYLSDSEGDAPDSQPLLLPRTPTADFHHMAMHATERTGLFAGGRSNRPPSVSSRSSGKRRPAGYGSINFPPSVPTSPMLQPYGTGSGLLDDTPSPVNGRMRSAAQPEDHVIHIDGDREPNPAFPSSTPPTPPGILRQRTMNDVEEDVCFPVNDRLTDGMGTPPRGENGSIRHGGRRSRRSREWPDLTVFECWSREEKEERTGGIRARQVSEPEYVGGRLRPTMRGWHREVEDLPYRFTYFNDELSATIHAQTISELVTPGETTFRDLFMPPPRKIDDDGSCSSDEGEEDVEHGIEHEHEPEHLHPPTKEEELSSSVDVSAGSVTPRNGTASRGSLKSSDGVSQLQLDMTPSNGGASATPLKNKSAATTETAGTPANGTVEEGERPTWWLDVMNPTKAEMKVFQDAFGIHPLTAEDILLQEPREKVELFRNYYLVSYRTFEQDPADEEYMEPVNFYIVVFRTGVLTFHFSMTPHCANVRRRIRQLKDYIDITADWISYALIDNITDAFGPIIQNIEEECDEIDDTILAEVESPSPKTKTVVEHIPGMLDKRRQSQLSTNARPSTAKTDDTVEGQDDASMLRRIATCRKKVMGLYRLMGNKADVIKGFSKRCNEHWEVAPRSEIGLYLGDIQDHIVTMVANLVHVEKILSRGHSNYLAHISIKMNERQEQTADTLGRLTVLGTIVLPMNIVTGLWGMNVLVPGQGDEDTLNWFWAITAGLLMFGIACYFTAKRVYGIM
ncbi:hypothetical protein Dda_3370 [Drechslerella dactyloides]|uniref:Uncharacterized protein n=1 Tax=Drechslerella dactyloides TaxID=74499 RepID=A0AAD6J158_DREDA|nr:hypothetical protein Dda_3370 [Drechslerella dactyloides]